MWADRVHNAIAWIAFADTGADDTSLRSAAISLLGIQPNSVRIWHPQTVRAAVTGLDGDGVPTLVSSGVTSTTAPFLILGWADIFQVRAAFGRNVFSMADAITIIGGTDLFLSVPAVRLYGHSGGGSLVEAAYTYIATRSTQKPSVEIVTYGSPKPGVPRQQAEVPSLKRLRFVSYGDPVPGLPYQDDVGSVAGPVWAATGTGPQFRPWEFSHPSEAILISRFVPPRSFFAPPQSSLPTTSQVTAWFTGNDGRSGFPHGSRTYLEILTKSTAQAAVDLVDEVQEAPTPAPPPRISLQTVISNEAPGQEVVTVTADAPTVPVDVDTENFGLNRDFIMAISNIDPKERFVARVVDGVPTLVRAGTSLNTFGTVQQARIAATKLNLAAVHLFRGQQANDAVTASLGALLGQVVPAAPARGKRRGHEQPAG